MNTAPRTVFLFLLTTSLVPACPTTHGSDDDAGARDVPPGTDAPIVATDAPRDTAMPVDAPVPSDAGPPASCAELALTCSGEGAVVLRAHAEGLVELEGARVEIGIRYILEEGGGLMVPRGVARGSSVIVGGAFERCVCVPNANIYPEVVGVIFRSGSTGLFSRDALRGTYSQRFAVLEDEDYSLAFQTSSTPVQREAAVAALDPRFVELTVRVGTALPIGTRVVGGLVGGERPIAAELAWSSVTGGAMTFAWGRPGPALADERLVLLADQNGDGRCNAGDLALETPWSGTPDISAPGPWLGGADLDRACAALSLTSSRE